jgi:DNA-binding SARP family transcriptional activator
MKTVVGYQLACGPDRSPRFEPGPNCDPSPDARPAEAAGVELVLLGGWRMRTAGVDVDVDVGLPPSVQRVVTYLALVGPTSRSVLAARLWPDLPPDRALHSLRSALHRLERPCPGMVLRGSGTVRLTPAVQVDVTRVVNWARAVLAAPGVPGPQPPPDLFREELLPGWFDEWVVLERDFFQQLRLRALEQYAEQLHRQKRVGQALEVAYCVIRADPLRESAHRVVVAMHLAEGNLAAALRHFERFRALLDAELGIEPTDQLVALVRALRPAERRHDGDARGSQR